jgi:hypothetical protein
MIRGMLLDQNAYRAAAEDEKGNNDAAIAAGIVFLAGALGPYLMTMSFGSFLSIGSIIGLTVVGIGAFLAGIYAVSAASMPVAQVRLSFGQIFRPLAYAQSIGVLSFIPVVGMLLGLWRLVTSVAAVRAIAGCDVVKAIILLLIGFVASFVVSLVAAPLVIGLFRFF